MVLTPHRIVALGVLALFAAACEAPTTGPNVEVAFAKGGNGGGQACPIPADVVVTDEASILAAIASAAPGDVIGVDGTIGLTAALFLDAPGVTYTCATRGSGFTALTPFGGSNLLFAPVADVTVSDLVLDGSAVVGAFLIANNASRFFICFIPAITKLIHSK